MQRAMIIGSGASGVNLALALAGAGIKTALIEPASNAAERAAFFLCRLSDDPAATSGPVVQNDLSGLIDATWIFEAVDQDWPVWEWAVASLSRALPKDTLLAVTGPLEKTLKATPDALHCQMLGFQAAAPAHLRQLVEITPAPRTRSRLIESAFELARVLGKFPVAVPFGRASIATRLRWRMYEAADTMLTRGAIAHELDEAMVAFGFDMGICQAQDLIGLDIACADRARHAAARGQARRMVPIVDRMVQEGRLGKKAGVGWYRYPGGGGAVIDPLIEDLIREEAWFEGIAQRHFSAEQMQMRMVLALIHEGCAMLADGTATDATAIDAVSVHGLGFPAHAGGVMAWARLRGSDRVRVQLAALGDEDPALWPPVTLSL